MTNDRQPDRDEERRRYDQRALDLVRAHDEARVHLESPEEDHLRAPYDAFRAALDRLVTPESKVLEIGSGTGRYTRFALSKSPWTIPVDISHESLKLACAFIEPVPLAVAADIAQLPIASSSVDVVIGAGALSYADPDQLDAEMCRVLKPGGSLLIVDSLNHNPVYRFNRWRHYRRGERTASTLAYMPTMGRLETLAKQFEESSLTCFGTFTFLYPLARKVLGPARAASALERADERFGGGRNGFKFVLIAEGLRAS